MIYKNEDELFATGMIKLVNGKIEVIDKELFREKMVDNIVDTIILSNSIRMKKICHWLVYEVTPTFGLFLSSIQSLYEAKGKDVLPSFTVPAINLRVLTYDIAKAVFRSAKKINAGAFIFEIAKSEIGYTNQRPQEYVSCVLLAGIKEGYSGSVFVQGDHYQIKAKNYLQDEENEKNQLKELIKESIQSGFYNIDIDSSTLVDLSKPNVDEQQKLNYEVCAFFTKFIRELQPQGIEISIGGEIGEVGGKNSTPEELRAFMRGYISSINGIKGISKISIQTGTTHGGVVLPDGSIARVNIDFETLRNLSKIAKEEFSLAGAVQHGASTLPNDAFYHFPQVGCAEIHLATQFQNIVYDYLPLGLKEKIYTWLNKNCADERKPGQSDDQFIYTVRKKALGPFKREIYSLPQDLKDKISSVLEEEFSFLFDKLDIKDTKDLVDRYIKPVIVDKKREDFLGEDKDLGELEGAD
ncbi:MAG: class II fructose-bisphosphate aldolase [Candidatus Omnitrophica bacterium]|nr:class II fructose-bisphosphate aldolase [Candidatus Omnitrophota bacterium]